MALCAATLFERGDVRQPGEAVRPALPGALATVPAGPASHADRTHPRLRLARWLASPENGLAARVFVQRVWQQHFGVPLLPTPNDFGAMGNPPVVPGLLDWLASWFVHEAHGSTKRLHRLILTSAAYRMASHPDAADRFAREGQLVGFPRRRLSGEAIRDRMLVTSGLWNGTIHGPSFYPELPAAVLAVHSDPERVPRPDPPEERARRTLYAFERRSLPLPFLQTFDRPPRDESCGRRAPTTSAPQAATLLNGPLTTRCATALADRVGAGPEGDQAPDAELVRRLVLRALGRPATNEELEVLCEFVAQE